MKSACDFCAAFDPAVVAEVDRPSLERFEAIWDTGATDCVISQDVVDRCHLKPITMTQVQGVHGVAMAEVYLVNMRLPNGIMFRNVRVTKGDLGSAHALIGMNIITLGDFSITNKGGVTVFSFRYPSQASVDYVKELKRETAHPPHGGTHKFGKNKKR